MVRGPPLVSAREVSLLTDAPIMGSSTVAIEKHSRYRSMFVDGAYSSGVSANDRGQPGVAKWVENSGNTLVRHFSPRNCTYTQSSGATAACHVTDLDN